MNMQFISLIKEQAVYQKFLNPYQSVNQPSTGYTSPSTYMLNNIGKKTKFLGITHCCGQGLHYLSPMTTPKTVEMETLQDNASHFQSLQVVQKDTMADDSESC